MAKKSREDMRKRRHQRVRQGLAGTPERPRLNVYRSLTEIYAQVIDDAVGKTLVSASSIDVDLRPKMGSLKKSEQARIVGQVIAERAKAKGISKVVFDRGGYRYQGRVRELAEAARKAGLDF
jgi:large subunit ribosomal protein L18